MRITNFKKKKTKLLTKGQQKSHENAKICYICKEKFENEIVKNKKGYCHHTGENRCAGHSICNLKCSVPKTIYTAFHNGSKFGYNFTIKKLAEKSKK